MGWVEGHTVEMWIIYEGEVLYACNLTLKASQISFWAEDLCPGANCKTIPDGVFIAIVCALHFELCPIGFGKVVTMGTPLTPGGVCTGMRSLWARFVCVQVCVWHTCLSFIQC